jgi:radical SAM protein with 4Fe4S-binding SPASM domain
MKQPLRYIIFETTRDCNLSCRYCYNYWNTKRSKEHPKQTYSKSLKTIKKLFSLGQIQHITFTGGEPFLSERFPEVVLYCRMKNKNVTVISNGNGAGSEEYKTLIDMGVSLFEFPIQSYDPMVHDYLTQVNGSWERSVESIKSVLNYKGNAVAVIVLTKINIADIEKTLEFLNNTGVKQIMLARFNIGGRGIIYKDELIPRKSDLQQAFKTANEYSRKNGITISSNVCVPHCIINPKEYPSLFISSCSADITRRPITIDYTGDFRLCNHSPIIIGNIFKDKPENIFSSEYISSWRNNIPEYCKECNIWEKCLGGCRAASEQIGQDVGQVDPIVKMIK